MMEKFAGQYHLQNPDTYRSADTVFVLAFRFARPLNLGDGGLVESEPGRSQSRC